MSATHLNDTLRLHLALAASPDIINDPQGLDSPLADWAARLGVSPAEFCEICREFQKLRADHMAQRRKDDGVGGSLDLQGLDPVPQNTDFIGHQKSPIGTVCDLSSVNAKASGVQQ